MGMQMSNDFSFIGGNHADACLQTTPKAWEGGGDEIADTTFRRSAPILDM
jgi:hypothetical protein